MKMIVHWLTGNCLSLGSMMNDYKVETINDSANEFNVVFNGPKNSKLDFHCFC